MDSDFFNTSEIELDKLYYIEQSYNHIGDKNTEYLIALDQHYNEHITPNHLLGHMLSKIMQSMPIIKKYAKLSPLYNNDETKKDDISEATMKKNYEYFEKYKSDLKEIYIDDNELLDIFLISSYGKCYPYNSALYNIEFIKICNIENFINLCVENSNYCSLEYLTILTTLCHSTPNSPIKRFYSKDKSEQNPLTEISSEIMKQLFLKYDNNKGDYVYSNSYDYEYLSDICFVSLFEIFSSGYIIKRCANCGNYFVPTTRSDAMFCDEISPQDNNKTCKEYGNYINYLTKTQTDTATKLYKQIYNQKANKAKRYENNKSVKNDLENFIAVAKEKREAIKQGNITEDSFINWLQDVKAGKVVY